MDQGCFGNHDVYLFPQRAPSKPSLAPTVRFPVLVLVSTHSLSFEQIERKSIAPQLSIKLPKTPEQGEEASVGLKADLKTLQQLTSSAEAAKRHRDESKLKRIHGALDEAVHVVAKTDAEPENQNTK